MTSPWGHRRGLQSGFGISFCKKCGGRKEAHGVTVDRGNIHLPLWKSVQGNWHQGRRYLVSLWFCDWDQVENGGGVHPLALNYLELMEWGAEGKKQERALVSFLLHQREMTLPKSFNFPQSPVMRRIPFCFSCWAGAHHVGPKNKKAKQMSNCILQPKS